MGHRLDHYDNGEVIQVAILPGGSWARSEFPQPLVTVDFDSMDRIIGVTGVGPLARGVVRAYSNWLESDSTDPADIIKALRQEEATR